MKTVEDLVTNSYLLLELRSCLVDRYHVYAGRNDNDGMTAIENLHYQLFGKSIFGQEVKKMLEFHLKNLCKLVDLRDKAMLKEDYKKASYYDFAIVGCIYFLCELYKESGR